MKAVFVHEIPQLSYVSEPSQITRKSVCQLWFQTVLDTYHVYLIRKAYSLLKEKYEYSFWILRSSYVRFPTQLFAFIYMSTIKLKKKKKSYYDIFQDILFSRSAMLTSTF